MRCTRNKPQLLFLRLSRTATTARVHTTSLSVYLSVCLSVCLCVCLSVGLFVYHQHKKQNKLFISCIRNEHTPAIVCLTPSSPSGIVLCCGNCATWQVGKTKQTNLGNCFLDSIFTNLPSGIGFFYCLVHLAVAKVRVGILCVCVCVCVYVCVSVSLSLSLCLCVSSFTALFTLP